MLHLVQTAFLFAFPALVIFGAMRDAVSFTIPNWISIALAAAFLPTALIMGASPGQMGIALLIGVGALVAGMGMFAVGWIGGGDAKLFAAAGLWMGLGALLPYLLVTALAGVGMLVSTSMAFSPHALAGDAMGVITAIFYAWYLLSVKSLRAVSKSISTLPFRRSCRSSLPS